MIKCTYLVFADLPLTLFVKHTIAQLYKIKNVDEVSVRKVVKIDVGLEKIKQMTIKDVKNAIASFNR